MNWNLYFNKIQEIDSQAQGSLRSVAQVPSSHPWLLI